MSFLSLWEENRSSKTDYVLKRLSREIEKDRFEMIMNKLNQIQKEMKKQRRSFIKKQEGKNGKRN
jgi:5-bromo-4-chloroindolyl phosphate hydrolysis protein